jgi:lysophospholipid acyltransferase (LPLAT)-like uncharacterized protein
MNNVVKFLKYHRSTQPMWNVLQYPIGFLMYLKFVSGLKFSKRITVLGNVPKSDQPVIFVSWHKHLPFLLPHNGSFRRYILSSDDPYMACMQFCCSLLGFKVVEAGSSKVDRTGKRQSAVSLMQNIIKNEQTAIFIAVDGPAGPPEVVKMGCIELSRRTGQPMVPQSWYSKKQRPDLSRWDQWLHPGLFGDEITVKYGEPIYFEEKLSMEVNGERVKKALKELDQLR